MDKLGNVTSTFPSTDSDLVKVYLPSSETSIGASAFQSCYALSSIVIPSSVTSIGSSTFSNCYALSSVVIPSSVTSISSYAFNTCYALSSIVIPSSVTSIGNFAFYNCFALGIVTINATTPPTLGGTNAFSTTYQKRIYVPSASVSAYKAATNWSTFASIIYAIPS